MSMTHPAIFVCTEDSPMLYYVCGLLSALPYTEAVARIVERLYERYTDEDQ